MGLTTATVEELRGEFPALRPVSGRRPLIFMDGPGGTQVHSSVIDAMRRYLVRANSNSGGAFAYSQRTDETAASARQTLADFVNAGRPEEIVFGPNMTSLTFAVSRAIGRTLTQGDEIVVTELDHDANIAPWRALEEQGAIVRVVGFHPEDCTLDMRSLEAALSPRTRVVAVGYASNAVGTVNDVRRVIELAHAIGAWVYVDAVHLAPHAPIDVQALDCDFLVCSAYKFFGPHLGVLYGRYDRLESLPAYKVRPAHDEPPHKFETGTLSFEALAGATAAVDYLASVGRRFGREYATSFSAFSGRRRDLKAGMTAIRDYEQRLLRHFMDGLVQVPGLRVYGITDAERFCQRVPTVSFTLAGTVPRHIATVLGQAGISVWDGNFYAPGVTERLGLESSGGLLRVGLVHYNTHAEVDTLLEQLSALRRVEEVT